MSSVIPQSTPVHEPEDGPEPRSEDRFARLALVALYALGVVVISLLALREKTPSNFPDEYTYGHLARTLAGGDGFDWNGAPTDLSAALYVYFIAPAWLIASGPDAYAIARVESILALCSVVFPVWLLAREFVGARLALVPAALSLMGTWTVLGSSVMTENLALPLGTACLAALVLCLRRPSTRLAVLALAFAALATWARLQMVVLFGVILAGVVLDVAAHGRSGWRARAREQRVLLAASGAIAAVAAVVLLAAPSVTGFYDDVVRTSPGLGRTLRKTGLQLAELVAVSGVLAPLVATAAALLPSSWRDARLRPLVTVFAATALGFALQSGVYLAGYPAASWGIERYVVYAAPLTLVVATVVLATPGVRRGRILGIAGALALLLLFTPAIRAAGEERALRGTVDLLGGVFDARDSVLFTAVALLAVGLAAAVSLRLRGRAPALALALGAIAACLLLVQAGQGWDGRHRGAENSRSQLPADLQWVDHNSRGPVALLAVSQVSFQFADLEFFSDSIERVYVPSRFPLGGRAPLGRRCGWEADGATGRVVADPACGPMPRTLLIGDPATRVRFYGEQREVRDRWAGRLVELSGEPRIRSVLQLPCGPRVSALFLATNKLRPASEDDNCDPALRSTVWLDAPGRIELRFRGGDAPHAVASQQRRWVLQPARETTISIPAPAGPSGVALNLDWNTRDGNPELVGADIVQGSARTSML